MLLETVSFESVKLISRWQMAELTQRSQCGKTGNSLIHFFDTNFVKVKVLQKKSLKS